MSFEAPLTAGFRFVTLSPPRLEFNRTDNNVYLLGVHRTLMRRSRQVLQPVEDLPVLTMVATNAATQLRESPPKVLDNAVNIRSCVQDSSTGC